MPKEPFNLGERLKDYNKILSDLPIMNEIFPYTATTVVIDTNILLSELYWMLRNKRNSTLLTLVQSKRVILFFPAENVNEIEEHIPDIAEDLAIEVSEVRDLWQRTYAPYLRVVPDLRPDMSVPLEDKLKARDSDDAPFLRLASMLKPEWFLSQDKDLIMVGAQSDYVKISIDLREYHAGKTVVYSFEVGGQVFSVVGVGLITAMFEGIRAVLTLLLRMHNWLKIVILLCLVVSLSSKRGRSLISNIIKLLPKRFAEGREVLTTALTSAFDWWESGQALKSSGEGKLAQYEEWPQSRLRPNKAEDFIIEILATSPEPLSELSIARRVIGLGYTTKNQNFDRYVARILQSKAVFSKTTDNKWMLGSTIEIAIT